ncbi:MAG TPA: RHS repeat-associated core domain-containing protein [Oculatellaceae cyanobacterium]
MIQINYPGSGNYSTFTYDPYGQNVKIVETVAGSITSTKQFVWDEDDLWESRDSSGTVLSMYFGFGQSNSGTSCFNTLDLLGSTTETTDSSGTVLSRYFYDPFGQVTSIGTVLSDFQYAGYYVHGRSTLNLAIPINRAYSAKLGRWLSRDPIEEEDQVNLYAYADNAPTEATDETGLVAGMVCQARRKPNQTPAQPPPWFPDCPAGDVECCNVRFNDCQSRCRQRFRFSRRQQSPYQRCIRCCEQNLTACVRNDPPNNPYPGDKWTDCFKSDRGRRGPGHGRAPRLGGVGGAGGGGGGRKHKRRRVPPDDGD